MRQRLSHELLDDDAGTPAEIRQSLDELWWINQHLGGLSSWRTLLARCLEGAKLPPGPLRVLDIGSGTGQVAAANAAWLGERGFAVTAVTLDRRPSHLERRNARGAVAADAFQLPFADRSFDLVTCNLFLHHFHDQGADDAATRLLREMARVAARAVLINDLERAWPPYLAILALGRRFSRITRHDGPASVRQAYTCDELEALARAAGAAAVEVLRLPRYRLGLIWNIAAIG